jgi:hypothetical protein
MSDLSAPSLAIFPGEKRKEAAPTGTASLESRSKLDRACANWTLGRQYLHQEIFYHNLDGKKPHAHDFRFILFRLFHHYFVLEPADFKRAITGKIWLEGYV